MVDHALEIFPGTTVIGAQETIHLPAAASEIPGKGIPSSSMEGGSHSLYGGIRGIPLQPMGDNDKGLRAVIAIPIEIEKIPIRSLDALLLASDRAYMPQQNRNNRLEMAIRQSPWRSVGGGCKKGHERYFV